MSVPVVPPPGAVVPGVGRPAPRPAPRSAPRPAAARLAGLDGLRGVAALVVLVHHSLLLTPALMAPYQDPSAPRSALVQAFTATPLHLLWDGEVAVQVFFVLSGFVLTVATQHPDHRWDVYYPRRLLRLYLPVWAAVALAVVLRAAVPAPGPEGLSPWLAFHGDLGRTGVLADLGLLAGPVGSTMTALWSLRWEVLFSLLLPVFVLAAARLRRVPVATLGVLALIAWAGAATGPVDQPYALGALFQLPVFGVGCVLAVQRERIADAVRGWGNGAWTGTLVVAALLACGYWLLDLGGLRAHVPVGVVAATRVLQVVGAALLVVAAQHRLDRPLRRPAVHWLGTRSFSLYLVHEPVVVAVGRLTAATTPAVLLVTVPVSLALAEVFFRAVERPSLRLSRRVGERVRTRRAAPRGGRHVDPAPQGDRVP